VNHIDGDSKNNVYSNLEFLCPNCHSQTPNFRALNRKSTREYRVKK
jgi:5-methylcytosine-specific restriction endonuclease McrA